MCPLGLGFFKCDMRAWEVSMLKASQGVLGASLQLPENKTQLKENLQLFTEHTMKKLSSPLYPKWPHLCQTESLVLFSR